MLSYLSLRKCYEVDNNYLMKAVKQSKSPCLKINTWEGMITWKYATKECRLDKWMNGGKFFKSIRFYRHWQHNPDSYSTVRVRIWLPMPVFGEASPQFTERQFFGTELHSPYGMHFLKADSMWNVYVDYLNFQKYYLCIKADASIFFFF